jgi:hypothetical protein
VIVWPHSLGEDEDMFAPEVTGVLGQTLISQTAHQQRIELVEQRPEVNARLMDNPVCLAGSIGNIPI